MRGGRLRAVTVGASAAIAAIAPAPAQARPAVAFQIDVAHDGHQTARSPRPPLHRAWTRRLGTGEHRGVSYPLIAGRRVYVTVAAGRDYSGSNLLALDARDGRTLWSRHIPDSYGWSAPAYDRGRVFAVNSNQHVYAFRARTGARLWDRSFGGSGGTAPPVAWHGLVYAASATAYSDPQHTSWDGGLAALRESDGKMRWNRPAGEYSSDAAVAIGRGHVFADFASCPQDFAFGARSGRRVWRRLGNCYGLGDQTPALHRGRLYVATNSTCRCNEILDAVTGHHVGTYGMTHRSPVFRGSAGYFVDGLGLHARNVRTGRRMWSFRHYRLGNPLVVGRTVYVPTATGRVLGLDAISGKRRWAAAVPGSVTEEIPSSLGDPTGGMAAASGMLLTPTVEGYLVAFRGKRR